MFEHELDERITVDSVQSYSEQFENFIKSGSARLIVAIVDSKIVGVIDYIAYSKGTLKIGSIGNIFVLEEYRKTGVGTGLASFAMEKLAREKCEYIVSGVRTENREAQKFWEKRGFKIDRLSNVNYSMRKELE